MPPPPLLAAGAPCSSSADENPISRLSMSASSGLASTRTFLLSRSRLRRAFRRATTAAPSACRRPASGEEDPPRSNRSRPSLTQRPRSIPSFKSTRAVDLKSNGPHCPQTLRPVRSLLTSVRSHREIPAVDPYSNDESHPGRPPFEASSGNPFDPTSPDDPFGVLSEDDTCPGSRPINPFGAFPKPCQMPFSKP